MKDVSFMLTLVGDTHKVVERRTSGVARGGGHGPRAQALEGAPAQLVGATFKKMIRPRQISDFIAVRWINLVAKVAYMLCYFFFFFFFLLVDFFPWGGCRIYQTGGGANASIGPRALETLATPLRRTSTDGVR